VIAARKRLPNAEKLLDKYGPWTNFLLILVAVYGPRLVMLWKMWEADRAREKKRLAVMPARADSEAAPDVDPGKAVN